MVIELLLGAGVLFVIFVVAYGFRLVTGRHTGVYGMCGEHGIYRMEYAPALTLL
jgi:hypothetical protein